MATFNGNVVQGWGVYDNQTWNASLGSKDTLAGGAGGDSRRLAGPASNSFAGSQTDTQPIDLHAVAFNGNQWPQFGFLDWYNRVHFQQFIDLGNLISVQVRSIEVFNAYFEDRVLDAVAGTNAEGLNITAPGAYPYSFGPLESGIFELQADTEGPAVIDATFDFTFDNQTLVLVVVGVRVIAWQFQPDWRSPIIERLEWLTDVMRSYSGREQRMALRTSPRSTWEFSFNVGGTELNLLESTVFNWHARVWSLPIWTDASVLLAEVEPGDVTIQCDTTYRDFHVGGLAILSTQDGTVFEAVEISAVAAGELSLARPTSGAWQPGITWVFPARTARLAERLRLRRLNARHAEGVATFTLTEPIARTAATEATTYRGYPVLTAQPNWRDGLDYSYVRVLDTHDTGLVDIVVDDGADLPVLQQGFVWTCSGKAEAEAMRAWLYARRGQLKALWVPTWANDLRLVDTVTSGQTNLDCENIGAALHLDADNQRQDIRIELRNGTVFYRRVIGVVEVSGAVERFSIDAALGVNVAVADVLRISWLSLMRLAQDSIEIAWSNPSVAEAAFALQGMRHDV